MNVIIVPVCIGKEMTQQCIASCLAQDIGDVWLYIIDNASTDGTGEWLRTLGVRTTLVTHRRPVGLHKVWNEALTLAFDSLRLPFALVVNNDVILRTDTYRLLRDDGALLVTGVGVDSVEAMEACDPKARSPHPSFSCFFMRKEVWDHIGEFDEQFHAYCGDLDYHLRMHAAGIEASAIAVPFAHVGSATMKLASNEERDRLQKLADNDRLLFEKKWGCKVGTDEYYRRFKAAQM